MNDMHALGRLIQDAQDRNEWSLRDLQERATARGYRMSHTNFGRLKTEPVLSVKGENISMLAQVLRVRVSTVVEAVLESMDLPYSGPSSPSVLDAVLQSNEISEYDQELLVAQLRVMLGRQKAGTHGAHHEHHQHDEHPAAGERRVAGAGQKTGGRYPVPADFDLAAHPPMTMARDAQDAEFEQLGEENQDVEDGR